MGRREVNDKNPKFEVGDHVRISEYKKCRERIGQS